ncbi:MAG: Smr/MutS family protein [Rhodospirillaceae bacterium]
MNRRRERLPSPDELSLWRLAMRDAVPLHPQPVVTPSVPVCVGPVTASPVPVQPAPPSPSPPPSPLPLPIVVAPPRGLARTTLPPLEVGHCAGIDRRTDERLRRGRLVVEARIDLHGLTQSVAHDTLLHFLEASYRVGRRCVLVITGKGPVSQGGGVLRQSVPRWLSEPGLRRLIVAVHRAQPFDGGDGALYVLVKRRREKKPGD